MFTNFQIELDLSKDFKHPYQLSYPLYASLMKSLNEQNIEILHQQNITPISQSVYQKENCIIWDINCFSNDLVEPIVSFFNDYEKIFIKRYKIIVEFKKVVSKQITLETINKHVDKLINQNSIRLYFHSTCSFKQNGQHQLFPNSQLIVQNLINRWNSHQDDKLHDVEVNNLIKNSMNLDYFSIRKSDFFLKGVKISGFEGLLVFKSQLAYPLKRILLALLVFGQYSGVGVKVALGMGHYSIVNEVRP